jgi:hypothetical protein
LDQILKKYAKTGSKITQNTQKNERKGLKLLGRHQKMKKNSQELHKNKSEQRPRNA